MGVLGGVFATWLSPGRYRGDEAGCSVIKTAAYNHTRHSRDEEADRRPCTSQDERNTGLLQSPRQPRAFVILLVDDGYQEDEERVEDPKDGDKDGEGAQTSCASG